MEPPVLNKPKVNITPKITKISSLAQSAEEIKKTSTKLRKTFESGAYQKKTQLTVLNRYKKRLDSIQKQNDKRFLKKQRVKIKLPEIKKFAGSFFTAGSDPLKSIGALAAFNALSKGAKGDILGALGPALVAAGIFFGPGLVKSGFSLARGGISKPGVTPVAKPLSSGSISRVNASQARFIQGQANIGDRARLVRRGFISPMGMFSRGGVEETAKYGANSSRVGKAFGRFGKAIIPGVGAAVGAIDATMRAQEGDRTGAAIAGTSATLDALAAASAATGIGLPIAGLLSIASFALDVTNLVRDLSGSSEKEAAKNKPQQDRLQQQTEEQKKLVDKKEGGTLTFGKSLDRYERVVNKFEQISKGFKITAEGEFDEPPMPAPTQVAPDAGYDGPISGDTFFPLPGGDVGTQGRVSASQGFGAPRDGGTRSHEGLDMTHWQGALDAPVAAYKTGKVVAAVSNGYNGYVEVDHGEGLRTLYYHTTPMVRVGEVVYGGQQIAKLYPVGGNTHLHFGISNNGRYTDPLPHMRAVKNKISTPLTKERAQQQSSSSSEVPGQGGFGVALSPVFQQPRTSTPGISIGAGGFNIDGRPVQTSAPRTQLRPSRSISQYASYERPQDQVIPVAVPIPQQMQQMMQGGSGGMMMSGPSEQDLLNSFYKRVLLNTVA